MSGLRSCGVYAEWNTTHRSKKINMPLQQHGWSWKGLREEKYVRRKKDKYQMISPEEYRQTLTADQRNKAPRRKGQGWRQGGEEDKEI